MLQLVDGEEEQLQCSIAKSSGPLKKLLPRNINNFKIEGRKKNPTTMTDWKIKDEDYLYNNDGSTKFSLGLDHK